MTYISLALKTRGLDLFQFYYRVLLTKLALYLSINKADYYYFINLAFCPGRSYNTISTHDKQVKAIDDQKFMGLLSVISNSTNETYLQLKHI